jgi:hypothetical protein
MVTADPRVRVALCETRDVVMIWSRFSKLKG